MDVPLSLAAKQRYAYACRCVGAAVLLDHLDGVGEYLSDERHMSKGIVATAAKDEYIAFAGWCATAVAKLIEPSTRIPGTIGQLRVEKIYGIAPGIGHTVVEAIVVVPLDKFDALILKAEVVAIGCAIAPPHASYGTVVIHCNAFKAIDDGAGTWLTCTSLCRSA